jgi:actin-related protein
MSTEVQAASSADQKISDKEFNFRQLETKYKTEVERERQARLEAEQRLQTLSQQAQAVHEEEESSDPYVDNRKLEKKLQRFGQNTQSEIQKAMEKAKLDAKEELKQELWLENNPDFFDVLQHAEKFAQTNPMLAETILKMPDSFERKKLVYANIKAMNLHKPVAKEASIQEKIDANRRSPYYQPTGVGSAPYANMGDFSDSGKKAAYEKMQQSKSRLRLG